MLARALGALRWRLVSVFQGRIGHRVRTLHFRRVFRRHLAARRDLRRVLDAGSGRGDFAVWVAQRMPWARVHGYDWAEGDDYDGNLREAERLASRTGVRNLHFERRDLVGLDEPGAFDLVYTIDVLEHIRGNARVLARLRDALRIGGLLYVAMPHERGRRRLLGRRFFADYDRWAAREHVGEQYRLGEMVALLAGLGLAVVEARHSFGPWGETAWELDLALEGAGVLGRLAKPLLKLMAWVDAWWPNAAGHLVVLARRER